MRDDASSSTALFPDARQSGRRKFFGVALRNLPADPFPLDLPIKARWFQYAMAVATVITVTALNLGLEKWIGHPAVAFVYLLAVVWIALFAGRGPILLGSVLTAIGWSFFFAPPKYSIRIAGSTDQMMVVIYFFVSLTVGQLTARLRAQRDAEIRNKLLAESERLGRTLLNSVSHELRTPIAAIDSAVTGLRACGPLSPVQQNLTAEVEAASLRLNRVVQSLLSAARIQSGHIRPKLDWCDIRDVFRAAQVEAGELGGRPIEIRIAAGLPLARIDFVLMAQALVNLLVNAATHTPAGTPIEFNARVERDELILEIADCGPGLPPDELERVFDLFHRAPSAGPGGTGLGLAIVKGFVEAQGGRVEAANRPEGGARFVIAIPAADAPPLPGESA